MVSNKSDCVGIQPHGIGCPQGFSQPPVFFRLGIVNFNIINHGLIYSKMVFRISQFFPISGPSHILVKLSKIYFIFFPQYFFFIGFFYRERILFCFFVFFLELINVFLPFFKTFPFFGCVLLCDNEGHIPLFFIKQTKQGNFGTVFIK